MLAFFADPQRGGGIGKYANQFFLNGTSQCAARNTTPTCHSPGLAAMNAVTALASNQSVAWEFIDALWQLPIPEGDERDSDRYYSGSLYLEALLHLSGNYRAWGCDAAAGSVIVKTDDGVSDHVVVKAYFAGADQDVRVVGCGGGSGA